MMEPEPLWIALRVFIQSDAVDYANDIESRFSPPLRGEGRPQDRRHQISDLFDPMTVSGSSLIPGTRPRQVTNSEKSTPANALCNPPQPDVPKRI